jgi:DNA modification methylase
VDEASNLGFGPEVYVTREKKDDVPVATLFRHQVCQMIADLEGFRPRTPPTEARVFQADARRIPESLQGAAFDTVVTSPPYPNEKDYTRAVRLELVLLGFVRNREQLQRLKRQFLRSNSRNIYVGDTDDQHIQGMDRVEELAHQIETRRLELGKTSGFERMYHKVVRHYFGGMAQHLRSLSAVLRPGACCAYVVGDQASFFLIHIHTAEILGEIAASLGYEVLGIDLWRERRATASGALLREEVLLLQWPG